jgi:hypothetical protein
MKYMRVGAFLLLVGTCAIAVTQDLRPGRNSTNADVAAIRAEASALIARGNPEDVTKGSALLQKALELEQLHANVDKLSLEQEKLRQDLESQKSGWKEALVTLGPIFTTVILAGTLIFQIWQARSERREKSREVHDENERKALERKDAREAEERQKEKLRFMDALRDIWTSEKVSTTSALISTFHDEPYRSWVMNTAISILLSRSSMEEFTATFMDVMNPIQYADLPYMATLCKEVDRSYFQVSSPIWNPTLHRTEPDKLTEENRKRYYLLDAQQIFLSQKLASFLRKPPAAGATTIDLSEMCLREADVSGADLGAMNLTGANWNYLNVEDCDFSGVTKFGGMAITFTAWWHAKQISKELLDYLTKNYPYMPGEKENYNSKRTLSQDDYRAQVSRLAQIAAG